MATLANKLSTPALIPWMPPGKPKESSSNVLVHKKNSGSYDYGSSIASSTVFNQPNKKKVSLEQKFWSPKKNSRKLTLGPEKERRIETLLKSSVNSQGEQDLLRSKIMGIFDEAEEHEKELEEQNNKHKKRRNSDPEQHARKHVDNDLSRDYEKDRNHRERSRSKSRSQSKNEDPHKNNKSHKRSSRSNERKYKDKDRPSSRSRSGKTSNDEKVIFRKNRNFGISSLQNR